MLDDDSVGSDGELDEELERHATSHPDLLSTTRSSCAQQAQPEREAPTCWHAPVVVGCPRAAACSPPLVRCSASASANDAASAAANDAANDAASAVASAAANDAANDAASAAASAAAEAQSSAESPSHTFAGAQLTEPRGGHSACAPEATERLQRILSWSATAVAQRCAASVLERPYVQDVLAALGRVVQSHSRVDAVRARLSRLECDALRWIGYRVDLIVGADARGAPSSAPHFGGSAHTWDSLHETVLVRF